MTEDDKLAEIACGDDGLWGYSEERDGYYQLEVSPAQLRQIVEALAIPRMSEEERAMFRASIARFLRNR